MESFEMNEKFEININAEPEIKIDVPPEKISPKVKKAVDKFLRQIEQSAEVETEKQLTQVMKGIEEKLGKRLENELANTFKNISQKLGSEFSGYLTSLFTKALSLPLKPVDIKKQLEKKTEKLEEPDFREKYEKLISEGLPAFRNTFNDIIKYSREELENIYKQIVNANILLTKAIPKLGKLPPQGKREAIAKIIEKYINPTEQFIDKFIDDFTGGIFKYIGKIQEQVQNYISDNLDNYLNQLEKQIKTSPGESIEVPKAAQSISENIKKVLNEFQGLLSEDFIKETNKLLNLEELLKNKAIFASEIGELKKKAEKLRATSPTKVPTEKFLKNIKSFEDLSQIIDELGELQIIPQDTLEIKKKIISELPEFFTLRGKFEEFENLTEANKLFKGVINKIFDKALNSFINFLQEAGVKIPPAKEKIVKKAAEKLGLKSGLEEQLKKPKSKIFEEIPVETQEATERIKKEIQDKVKSFKDFADLSVVQISNLFKDFSQKLFGLKIAPIVSELLPKISDLIGIDNRTKENIEEVREKIAQVFREGLKDIDPNIALQAPQEEIQKSFEKVKEKITKTFPLKYDVPGKAVFEAKVKPPQIVEKILSNVAQYLNEYFKSFIPLELIYPEELVKLFELIPGKKIKIPEVEEQKNKINEFKKRIRELQTSPKKTLDFLKSLIKALTNLSELGSIPGLEILQKLAEDKDIRKSLVELEEFEKTQLLRRGRGRKKEKAEDIAKDIPITPEELEALKKEYSEKFKEFADSFKKAIRNIPLEPRDILPILFEPGILKELENIGKTTDKEKLKSKALSLAKNYKKASEAFNNLLDKLDDIIISYEKDLKERSKEIEPPKGSFLDEEEKPKPLKKETKKTKEKKTPKTKEEEEEDKKKTTKKKKERTVDKEEEKREQEEREKEKEVKKTREKTKKSKETSKKINENIEQANKNLEETKKNTERLKKDTKKIKENIPDIEDEDEEDSIEDASRILRELREKAERELEEAKKKEEQQNKRKEKTQTTEQEKTNKNLEEIKNNTEEIKKNTEKTNKKLDKLKKRDIKIDDIDIDDIDIDDEDIRIDDEIEAEKKEKISKKKEQKEVQKEKEVEQQEKKQKEIDKKTQEELSKYINRIRKLIQDSQGLISRLIPNYKSIFDLIKNAISDLEPDDLIPVLEEFSNQIPEISNFFEALKLTPEVFDKPELQPSVIKKAFIEDINESINRIKEYINNLAKELGIEPEEATRILSKVSKLPPDTFNFLKYTPEGLREKLTTQDLKILSDTINTAVSRLSKLSEEEIKKEAGKLAESIRKVVEDIRSKAKTLKKEYPKEAANILKVLDRKFKEQLSKLGKAEGIEQALEAVEEEIKKGIPKAKQEDIFKKLSTLYSDLSREIDRFSSFRPVFEKLEELASRVRKLKDKFKPEKLTPKEVIELNKVEQLLNEYDIAKERAFDKLESQNQGWFKRLGEAINTFDRISRALREREETEKVKQKEKEKLEASQKKLNSAIQELLGSLPDVDKNLITPLIPNFKKITNAFKRAVKGVPKEQITQAISELEKTKPEYKDFFSTLKKIFEEPAKETESLKRLFSERVSKANEGIRKYLQELAKKVGLPLEELYKQIPFISANVKAFQAKTSLNLSQLLSKSLDELSKLSQRSINKYISELSGLKPEDIKIKQPQPENVFNFKPLTDKIDKILNRLSKLFGKSFPFLVDKINEQLKEQLGAIKEKSVRDIPEIKTKEADITPQLKEILRFLSDTLAENLDFKKLKNKIENLRNKLRAAIKKIPIEKLTPEQKVKVEEIKQSLEDFDKNKNKLLVDKAEELRDTFEDFSAELQNIIKEAKERDKKEREEEKRKLREEKRREKEKDKDKKRREIEEAKLREQERLKQEERKRQEKEDKVIEQTIDRLKKKVRETTPIPFIPDLSDILALIKTQIPKLSEEGVKKLFNTLKEIFPTLANFFDTIPQILKKPKLEESKLSKAYSDFINKTVKSINDFLDKLDIDEQEKEKYRIKKGVKGLKLPEIEDLAKEINKQIPQILKLETKKRDPVKQIRNLTNQIKNAIDNIGRKLGNLSKDVFDAFNKELSKSLANLGVGNIVDIYSKIKEELDKGKKIDASKYSKELKKVLDTLSEYLTQLPYFKPVINNIQSLYSNLSKNIAKVPEGVETEIVEQIKDGLDNYIKNRGEIIRNIKNKGKNIENLLKTYNDLLEHILSNLEKQKEEEKAKLKEQQEKIKEEAQKQKTKDLLIRRGIIEALKKASEKAFSKFTSFPEFRARGLANIKKIVDELTQAYPDIDEATKKEIIDAVKKKGKLSKFDTAKLTNKIIGTINTLYNNAIDAFDPQKVIRALSASLKEDVEETIKETERKFKTRKDPIRTKIKLDQLIKEKLIKNVPEVYKNLFPDILFTEQFFAKDVVQNIQQLIKRTGQPGAVQLNKKLKEEYNKLQNLQELLLRSTGLPKEEVDALIEKYKEESKNRTKVLKQLYGIPENLEIFRKLGIIAKPSKERKSIAENIDEIKASIQELQRAFNFISQRFKKVRDTVKLIDLPFDEIKPKQEFRFTQEALTKINKLIKTVNKLLTEETLTELMTVLLESKEVGFLPKKLAEEIQRNLIDKLPEELKKEYKEELSKLGFGPFINRLSQILVEQIKDTTKTVDTAIENAIKQLPQIRTTKEPTYANVIQGLKDITNKLKEAINANNKFKDSIIDIEKKSRKVRVGDSLEVFNKAQKEILASRDYEKIKDIIATLGANVLQYSRVFDIWAMKFFFLSSAAQQFVKKFEDFFDRLFEFTLRAIESSNHLLLIQKRLTSLYLNTNASLSLGINIFKSLTEMSVKTVFTIEDLTSAFTQFKAIGIENIDVFKKAVDTATAFGTEVASIADDIARAIEGDATAYKNLRHSIGLTNLEIRKLGGVIDASGRIFLRNEQAVRKNAEALVKYLNKFEGTAERTLGTIGQALKNLSDGFVLLKIKALEGLEPLKVLIQEITSSLFKLSSSPALTALIQFLSLLTTTVAVLGKTFTALLTPLLATVAIFANLINITSSTAIGLILVAQNLKPLLELLRELNPKLAETTMLLLKGVGDWVGQGGKMYAILEKVKNIIDNIASKASVFGKIFVAYFFVALPTIKEVDKKLEKMSLNLKNLAKVLADSLRVLYVGFLAILSKNAFDILNKIFAKGNINNFFKGLMANITVFFTIIWSNIQKAFAFIMLTIGRVLLFLPPVILGVVKFTTVFTILSALLKALYPLLGLIIKAIFGALQFLLKVSEFVSDTLIILFENIYSLLKNLSSALSSFVSNTPILREVFGFIVNAAKTIYQFMVGTINTILEAPKTIITLQTYEKLAQDETIKKAIRETLKLTDAILSFNSELLNTYDIVGKIIEKLEKFGSVSKLISERGLVVDPGFVVREFVRDVNSALEALEQLSEFTTSAKFVLDFEEITSKIFKDFEPQLTERQKEIFSRVQTELLKFSDKVKNISFRDAEDLYKKLRTNILNELKTIDETFKDINTEQRELVKGMYIQLLETLEKEIRNSEDLREAIKNRNKLLNEIREAIIQADINNLTREIRRINTEFINQLIKPIDLTESLKLFETSLENYKVMMRRFYELQAEINEKQKQLSEMINKGRLLEVQQLSIELNLLLEERENLEKRILATRERINNTLREELQRQKEIYETNLKIRRDLEKIVDLTEFEMRETITDKTKIFGMDLVDELTKYLTLREVRINDFTKKLNSIRDRLFRMVYDLSLTSRISLDNLFLYTLKQLGFNLSDLTQEEIEALRNIFLSEFKEFANEAKEYIKLEVEKLFTVLPSSFATLEQALSLISIRANKLKLDLFTTRRIIEDITKEKVKEAFDFEILNVRNIDKLNFALSKAREVIDKNIEDEFEKYRTLKEIEERYLDKLNELIKQQTISIKDFESGVKFWTISINQLSSSTTLLSNATKKMFVLKELANDFSEFLKRFVEVELQIIETHKDIERIRTKYYELISQLNLSTEAKELVKRELERVFADKEMSLMIENFSKSFEALNRLTEFVNRMWSENRIDLLKVAKLDETITNKILQNREKIMKSYDKMQSDFEKILDKEVSNIKDTIGTVMENIEDKFEKSRVFSIFSRILEAKGIRVDFSEYIGSNKRLLEGIITLRDKIKDLITTLKDNIKALKKEELERLIQTEEDKEVFRTYMDIAEKARAGIQLIEEQQRQGKLSIDVAKTATDKLKQVASEAEMRAKSLVPTVSIPPVDLRKAGTISAQQRMLRAIEEADRILGGLLQQKAEQILLESANKYSQATEQFFQAVNTFSQSVNQIPRNNTPTSPPKPSNPTNTVIKQLYNP